MRCFFTILYLLVFWSVGFSQPMVENSNKRALESLDRFCDTTQSDDSRLLEAERLKQSNLFPTPQVCVKLAVVAREKTTNDEIRAAALVLWYRNEPTKAVQASLDFLKDYTDGNLGFRLGCLQLVFIELLNAVEEQQKSLVATLEVVMNSITDDIPVRAAIIFNLGRRNNSGAIAFCVKAVAENIVEPSIDCPINIRMAIDVLQSNKYFSYLRTAFNNPEPEIRLLLVDALSWDSSLESFNTLVSVLQDTHEDVRVRAAAIQVVYMRHAEYPALIIPLIRIEEDDGLRKTMIRTLHLYVRHSDWMALKAHREKLKELAAICDEWSKSMQGESQAEAAVAADHFNRLQKEK